jgi:SNF2 family DNA or RNA helicase
VATLKPAPFQIEGSQFVYERDNSMLFARMGTGKTLTYLMAMQDWKEAGDVKRTMVVAPLRVARNVWRQERDKWEMPLTMSLATGEMSKLAQRAAVEADTDVLVTNYEMFEKLLADGTHRCEAVVFDELSRLRNGTGKRQKAARHAPFKIKSGGTGTPAPNGLTSIYGMAQAIGIGTKLFGRSHDKWLRRYFYPEDFEQRKWIPFGETMNELSAIIKPYTFVQEDNAVELPTIVRPPIDLQLPAGLRDQYDRLRATSVLSDHDIIAGNAGVLRNKLRQIASGFIYDNAGEPVGLDPYRLDAVEAVVEEQNGRPIIIAYEFREQLAMMLRRWPDLRFIGGDSTDDERTIEDWNAGRIEKLALHPASAGHGLNLQGGGNAVVWWQLPDDFELYDQTLGRLRRRGQEDDRVWSYEPSAVGTVDQTVRTQQHGKNRTQEGLWASLRR